MFARVEKRGPTPEKQYDLLICTLRKGEPEHSRPAVSFPLGSDEVTITGNVRSWGSIPIRGREAITLVRDGLNEVLARMAT